MAEITSTGYQSIRDFIEDDWTYIELRDGSGSAIIRIDVTDPRVSWTHSAGAQTLELTCIIKGSDSDITPPKTFQYSALYSVASGGSPHSVEEFTPFTIGAAEDELTVKHRIEVPQV